MRRKQETSATPPGMLTDAAHDQIQHGPLLIRDGAITAEKLQDGSVTNAKIESVDISKLVAGSIAVGQYIESDNYVAGSAGWRLDDNDAEFNDVVIRGTLAGATGTFSGNLSFASGTFTGTLTGGSIIGSSFETNPGSNNNNVEIGTLQPGAVTFHDSSGGYIYLSSDGGQARITTSEGDAALFIDSELVATIPFTEGRYALDSHFHSVSVDSHSGDTDGTGLSVSTGTLAAWSRDTGGHAHRIDHGHSFSIGSHSHNMSHGHSISVS